MNYVLLENKYTENYTKTYLKAVENKCEKECFIGNEVEYRMTSRESAFSSITDPAVLLEYCVYPLYINGDKEIGTRIQAILRELVSKANIIGIYQAVRFIYIQDRFIKKYEKLPMIVDVSGIVRGLLCEVEKLREQMKEYREGEFALYPKNMYELVQGMLKKIGVVLSS